MLSAPDITPNKIRDQLKKTTELYLIVKETILFFEEVNPEQKADIQPINELRNAFDHLMRSSAAMLEIKKVEDPESYILKNLDKAHGHVYRAGYDTVDFLCLTLKEYIGNVLCPYHTSSIITALPEYYSLIKPKLVQLEADIASHRNEKDIGETNDSRLVGYIRVATELSQFRQTIIRAIPSIQEVEDQRRKDDGKAEKRNWVRLFALVGITFFLTLFGRYIYEFVTGQSNSIAEPQLQQVVPGLYEQKKPGPLLKSPDTNK